MDLEWIKEFLTLSEKLNFSATAKQHFIAQSVLSRHIAGLEKELDAPLFYRNHQTVGLTEYGKMILPHMKSIAAEYEAAVDKIKTEKRSLSSALRVAYIFEIMGNKAGRLFDTFVSKYPDVTLNYDLIDSVTPTTHFMRQNPGVDIVINYLCEPLPSENYCTYELFQESLCLIVKKGHPLADRTSILLRDIQGEPLIECSRSQHEFYRERLRLALKEGNSTYIHSQDANSLKQTLVMIESGLGTAIAPYRYGRYNFPNLRAVPIEDESCKMTLAAIWNRDNLNPNIQRMVQVIKDHPECVI